MVFVCKGSEVPLKFQVAMQGYDWYGKKAWISIDLSNAEVFLDIRATHDRKIRQSGRCEIVNAMRGLISFPVKQPINFEYDGTVEIKRKDGSNLRFPIHVQISKESYIG